VELLLDLFGFLSVLLRGCTLAAQSFTVGGVAFVLLLAQPLAPALGAPASEIIDRARRLMVWSASALVAFELLTLALQAAVLTGTLDISPAQALATPFAAAAVAVGAGAAAIVRRALRSRQSLRAAPLALAALVILLAQVASSHAVARVDGRLPLAVAALLHMAAAGVWIGGLPYLLAALARTRDPSGWYLIGRRYSMMAMLSVAVLVAAGVAMALVYVGPPAAWYGTSYGVMVVAKALLLAGLLFLGAMNFRLVRRLPRAGPAAVLTLRRFVEAELGIGLTVLFAAGSLTSQPPGVDLTTDRASLAEVVQRITPAWPRLRSPEHDLLAISQLNARIAAATAQHEPVPLAFVPGEGQQPPRNAMDIAWSEFNHHWAGLLVLCIALLALLERCSGAQWARHWPLALVLLAVAIVVRSDPEVWPMGQIGVLESLRDPEVAQHRVLECLTALLGAVEWRAQTERTSNPRLPLIFPLLCALGGALLLTHSHALSNLKDQLLIEITHIPLALAVIVAAWARWIQLRLDGAASRIAGWIWPLALLATAASLLLYREQ
jgi:putative copper resistance protein D